jgi:hypothetical protein
MNLMLEREKGALVNAGSEEQSASGARLLYRLFAPRSLHSS